MSFFFRRDRDEEDEHADPSYSWFDDLSSANRLDAADERLLDKFSALKLGPFDAKITRQIVAKPTYTVSNSMMFGTCFTAKILPVQKFSFEIDFPKKILRNTSPAAFEGAIGITCGNPELRALLKSREFLTHLRALNAIAPGAIRCIGDTFSVQLFTALGDEGSLISFFFECEKIFKRYAQFLQLNVREWRMNAAKYDWWSEEDVGCAAHSGPVSSDPRAVDDATSLPQ